MYLYNSPEYCEANFAAFKIRGIPINVNYRYLDDELALPARQRRRRGAGVPHLARRSGGARARRGCRRCGCSSRSTTARRPTARRTSRARSRYEDMQADASRRRRASTPHGDDSTCFYTGGTTGMPKGVMYPMGDFTEFFLRIVPADDRAAADRRPGRAARPRRSELCDAGTPLVAMSGPPLMHGTGCWLGMMVPHLLGGTAVLLESRGLDAVELWDAGRARGRAAPHRRRRRVRQAAAARPRRGSPAAGTCRACG